MRVIGTGLSGLVGSRVVKLLSSYDFLNLSLETGVDITDAIALRQVFDRQTDRPWVFHFAAMTDVDKAEGERNKGETSSVWKVNVEATKHIVDLCKATGKRLLFLSTDYVFDGAKDVYTEGDIPKPLGWYAVTKYEGEKLVGTLGDHGLIVRIAYPYRIFFQGKPDFVHKILSRLANGEAILAPQDQYFVPTFVDDLAVALETLVKNEASGIYHAVGSQVVSGFSAAQKVAAVFGYTTHGVSTVKSKEFFKDRAPRPFRSVLKNDKIKKLGISMSTFDEGLAIVKRQEKNT